MTKPVTLFIAMSLDGYIADAQGGVSWLQGQDRDAEVPDTYAAFIQNIDTVLMGWNTYRQIVTQLSPGAWPYTGLSCYVLTHRTPPPDPAVQFVNRSPGDLLRELRRQPGSGIWICGGANLVRQCVREDLIDSYYLSIIPTVLGSGVRLFGTAPRECPLRLVRTQSYNGIVDLVYTRR